ncbi:15-hydroxyprostaglandin dehydrogenase [NAD(+)] isoform X2 [Eurytemora carolleeae]|uniref:15-hydroxyprostaglandin dehydrogenase [NAD(+)] isoform X2 n=1 Tax=Eurytemora carolleeae TaxID=1294199 RepID=UPI000C774C4A|nr:15-hydroxyprostaglandin dehydrogenase [NAD(+)] isoform X2 [Eurytemora carolleeae]XP_023319636.1 15-hydroxyprostaglandin dehydrogenase [NAD(+)] isoform X2 [Eurytemora carolleeae]|eukprot:XP_023319635.1 15-hydroxyprostaglandin dehydrogenase [NAD(+)]-like isoform X2 [Eurytemora affinis]
MNQLEMSGKVSFLTGGGGGLGRALASLLITRGSAVFLCDRSSEDLEKVVGDLKREFPEGKVGLSPLDVRSLPGWDKAWDECVDQLGSPAVVINIAGVKGEEDWEQTYDVNIKGVHNGIVTSHKYLSRETGGSGGIVVNISSTAGVTCIGDMFATPAYTASKHAVSALTRTFGHKFWYNRTGVSVIAVAPFYIDTPFIGEWKDWTPDTEAQKELEKSAAGKKILSPGEAALKIFNTFRAESGSIWLLRSGMFPPFNIPDYKLPQPKIL